MSATLKSRTKRRHVADEEPRPHLWTRAEYHQLGDAGFFEGRRVQLIEGSIVATSPQKLHTLRALIWHGQPRRRRLVPVTGFAINCR